MITKSDTGVWMWDERQFESVARVIAIDCMVVLGMDPSDFRTRDKVIVAISPRVQQALNEAAAMQPPVDAQ